MSAIGIIEKTIQVLESGIPGMVSGLDASESQKKQITLALHITITGMHKELLEYLKNPPEGLEPDTEYTAIILCTGLARSFSGDRFRAVIQDSCTEKEKDLN